MVLEMKIPSPGESITEVEISQWLVKDGDIVTKDQTIAEIDSDKATLDLPAEASGKITLKAEEGDSMSVGDIVCLIDTSDTSNSESVNSESPLKNIKEGDIVNDAIVKATTDWGIFLDINGIDALLHVSDLSHGRVKKPSDLVTIGQKIKVKI